MAAPPRRTRPQGTEERVVAEARPSFELFFEETHERLFGGLCLITGSRHEAEEIMQDAYLSDVRVEDAEGVEILVYYPLPILPHGPAFESGA